MVKPPMTRKMTNTLYRCMSNMKIWVRFAITSRLSHRRTLHTPATEKPSSSSNTSQQDLDFWKAADILFSETPKQKKFGWDFHLWQLFVACLPSVAIYLTAQYARREMRRMEKEREQENAEKMKIQTKELDEENRKLPGFQALEARLGAIEDKIKEMEVAKETIIHHARKVESKNSLEKQPLSTGVSDNPLGKSTSVAKKSVSDNESTNVSKQRPSSENKGDAASGEANKDK